MLHQCCSPDCSRCTVFASQNGLVLRKKIPTYKKVDIRVQGAPVPQLSPFSILELSASLYLPVSLNYLEGSIHVCSSLESSLEINVYAYVYIYVSECKLRLGGHEDIKC